MKAFNTNTPAERAPGRTRSPVIPLSALVLVLLSGCGGRKGPQSRARFKEQAREVIKQQAPKAVVRITKGTFRAEDSQGRLVMEARISDADAVLQPSDPSNGPVTLTHADLTLYKEGKPSLWLKAPVASWTPGLLTAPHGADSGSVDGKITLHGKKQATWTAKSNLLSVTTATCEVRDPGRPTLLAAGPAATWQSGLLTLPSGGTAHATDGSASMRGDQVRWRAKSHGLEATGRVRMTRGRLAGTARRLTGDTTLRQFRLSGGRPRVIFYNQAAPLVAMAEDGHLPYGLFPRRSPVPNPHSWVRVALVSAAVVLAAVLAPAAHAARQQVALNTGETVEADEISGIVGVVVHAKGKVIVTGAPGTQRTLGADQIDVTQSKSAAGASRSAVQEARATGHVRLISQPKPDERMEATGAAGTYWPGTQKATLTGGVRVTMASPQLQEPAVLSGAKADIDLAQRAADVTRTEAVQVALKLRPKADSSRSGSAAAGPVRLDADRIRMENAANRITATGSPVLTGDQGTVRAEKIWFDIDPKANDIRMVHAVNSVHIDSQDAQGGAFHGVADEAVMNRADDTVVLTGKVKGTHSRRDVPEPDRFSTDVLTYNQKTGEYRMGSSDDNRSRVTFKPRPRPAVPGDSEAAAAPAAPAKGKRSRGRRGH